MNSLMELYKLKEEAAAGAISAGSVAVNQGAGFSRDENSIGSKHIKRKKIKKIFKEDNEYDKLSLMSQIKNAEDSTKASKETTGFALEDDTGNIVKVYVKKEQAEDFEQALNEELTNNQNDEYSHREIGEIIYELKSSYDIVNIEMGAVPEDEEEIDKIESGPDDEADLELDKDSDDISDLEDDEMMPDAGIDDSSDETV